MKVLYQQQVKPIMASLREGDSPWHMLIFIDPRDWNEAKAMYGDKLEVVFGETAGLLTDGCIRGCYH